LLKNWDINNKKDVLNADTISTGYSYGDYHGLEVFCCQGDQRRIISFWQSLSMPEIL